VVVTADVYSVGLLHDLLFLARTVRLAPKHTYEAWKKLRIGFSQSWRTRGYWNGYLAEPVTRGGWQRCGHGWTKRRALKDLERHMARIAGMSG
jgi:hypothetical protein